MSGVLKCTICGTGLVGTVRRRKNKKFRSILNQNEINHQVEEIVLDMVADPDFKDYMVRRIDEKVDVSSLRAERDQIREQLRQVMGAKKKLTKMLDRLDVNDKH